MNGTSINKQVEALEINNNFSMEEIYENPDPYPGRLPRLEQGWGVKLKQNNWDNWRWQLKNTIKTPSELKEAILNENEALPESIEQIEQIERVTKTFPLVITPYYFSLIKKFDYTDPIFKQSIPDINELNNPSCLSNDPLHEEEDTVVNGLVHRYSDRALIISTSKCSMNCRHCTRKRVTGEQSYVLSDIQLDNIIKYLTEHSEIKDVIISGGDPFTMSTSKLEKIISRVRSVKSVDIIRIGTRTPVVMPMRITTELVNMISKYHPVFVNTHFNHPNEITEESTKACLKMINNGIPVNNQSVLLKGINDNPEIMAELCRKLLKIRVRPYYMFACDLVRGVEHFRTTINKGLEIMDYLRGRVSGLGIPQFILDSPEGKGKIPLLPKYQTGKDSCGLNTFRNYKGEEVKYPDPI